MARTKIKRKIKRRKTRKYMRKHRRISRRRVMRGGEGDKRYYVKISYKKKEEEDADFIIYSKLLTENQNISDKDFFDYNLSKDLITTINNIIKSDIYKRSNLFKNTIKSLILEYGNQEKLAQEITSVLNSILAEYYFNTEIIPAKGENYNVEIYLNYLDNSKYSLIPPINIFRTNINKNQPIYIYDLRLTYFGFHPKIDSIIDIFKSHIHNTTINNIDIGMITRELASHETGLRIEINKTLLP